MTLKARTYFGIGKFIVTGEATRVCGRSNISPIALLVRHMVGDWSETSLTDQKANRGAHLDSRRTVTSYRMGDETLTVVSDWESIATTICLDEER